MNFFIYQFSAFSKYFKRNVTNFLICSGLLFCCKSWAQNLSQHDNKLVIAVAPLALVDVFDGGSLRLSADLKVRSNLAVAMEAGKYLSYLNGDKINPNGFILKPTFKYYVNGHKAAGKYIALEYMYKQQDYEFKDSMAIDAMRFEKQYHIKRKVSALSIKYGNQINFDKNLVFEWYCGAGIRYMISTSNLSKQDENLILSGAENGCRFSEDFTRQTGNKFYPNILLGVKIGYKIR